MLTSCSGWFQPLPPHDHWRLHNSKILFPTSDPQRINKYLDRREKDMSDCGMDYVVGESDNPEVNLCLEKKGWYLEGGPICEEKQCGIVQYVSNGEKNIASLMLSLGSN